MGKVPVTDLTTTDATLWTSFAGGEGREVIVEEEALLTIVQDVVDELLVALCAEGDSRQRLRLTTGEDSGAMRSW